MAVNKNFVVKNGLEVGTDLILANTTNSRVGIGTSLPTDTLHVNGGIAGTDFVISGIATIPTLNSTLVLSLTFLLPPFRWVARQ